MSARHPRTRDIDAITQELIPHVERTFRGIGQPWARMLTGCSTGDFQITLGSLTQTCLVPPRPK